MLTAAESRKIVGLLLIGAVADNLIDTEIGVGGIRKSNRCRGTTDNLHRDNVRQIAHIGAAEFFWCGNAENADVTHLQPEISGEFVGFIDVCCARANFRLGKLGH